MEVIEGIITCTKNTSNKKYVFVGIKDKKLILRELSNTHDLKNGDYVSINEKYEIIKKITSDKKTEEKLLDIYSIAEKILDHKKEYTTSIKEIKKILSSMSQSFLNSSKLLIKKLITGSPIIVRFHNDADGSSGAYALFLAINELIKLFDIQYKPHIIWSMQKTVSYGIEDSMADLYITSQYSSLEKPLLLITDFGTSKQSNGGVEKVLEKFDIIWLEHHPIEEGFNYKKISNYINPWLFGGDSNITAGFLSCIFAYYLSGLELAELENASMIGDYSLYADLKKSGAELSAFLDMVTSDPRIISSVSNNLTPAEIAAVLNDKERYASLLSSAKIKMEESIHAAMDKIRQYKSKTLLIYVSDFSLSRNRESRYPLPGRFSSKLLDYLSSKNTLPCVLILYFGFYISIRVDKKIAEKLDILKIITTIKSEHEDDVEAGGGHISAASMKVSEGADKKEYIKLIVNMIKEKDNGEAQNSS